MAARRSRTTPARTRARTRPGRKTAALAPAGDDAATARTTPARALHLRELFWSNVVREMLTNLSVLKLQIDPAGKDERAKVFDGRVAVVTRRGVRLGIADVTPLFACGITTSEETREVSTAVECTVFRIVTPEGEVWTLPLSEIRTVHSLSEELIAHLEREANGANEPAQPFGFAAFTSLATGQRKPRTGKGGSGRRAPGTSPKT